MNFHNYIQITDGLWAELVGILLGDGSLHIKNRNGSQTRLKITCNSIDDSEYVLYLEKLISLLFNCKPQIRYRTSENAVDVQIFKRKHVEFVVDKLGLKLSPKWNHATIPTYFLQRRLSKYVVRGYFDTDGSVVIANNNGTKYPRIEMKICPSPMQEQFVKILIDHKLKFGTYKIGNGMIRVQLNGKDNLHQWMKAIGSSNPKHIRKSFMFQ